VLFSSHVMQESRRCAIASSSSDMVACSRMPPWRKFASAAAQRPWKRRFFRCWRHRRRELNAYSIDGLGQEFLENLRDRRTLLSALSVRTALRSAAFRPHGVAHAGTERGRVGRALEDHDIGGRARTGPHPVSARPRRQITERPSRRTMRAACAQRQLAGRAGRTRGHPDSSPRRGRRRYCCLRTARLADAKNRGPGPARCWPRTAAPSRSCGWKCAA